MRRLTTSTSGRITHARTTISGVALRSKAPCIRSLEKANTAWERFSHGFQLTTSLTAYSPLPFNITTGANTIQGTSARPTINGAFISRNAGEGHSILNLNVRLSRNFALGEHMRMQAFAEMFNTLNHVNVVTLNGVFGSGVYPTSPSPRLAKSPP